MIGGDDDVQPKSIQIDVVIEATDEPNSTFDTTTTLTTSSNLTGTNSNSNLNLNSQQSPVHQPFVSSSSNTILKLDEPDMVMLNQVDAAASDEPSADTDVETGGQHHEETRKRTKTTNVEQMAFLLSVFDNIVGPKIVHFWQFADTTNSSPARKSNIKSLYKYPLDSQMLKYIAIHTLNGELYQDKLKNQFKYRLYLIKEVECAIFSIFFDAFTISSAASSSCSFAQASMSMENEEFDTSPSHSITDSFLNKNAAFFSSTSNLNATGGSTSSAPGRGDRPPLQKVVTSDRKSVV